MTEKVPPFIFFIVGTVFLWLSKLGRVRGLNEDAHSIDVSLLAYLD
jgi:hypothetical protein